MPTTPHRRIVRRAAIAVAGVVLASFACWLATFGPSETERSRGIRLGMTEGEVDAVMGRLHFVEFDVPGCVNPRRLRYYGESQWRQMHWYSKVRWWFKLRTPSVADFPVRVLFRPKADGQRDVYVSSIKRGDEVEEVPRR
jgi:hypothetical protein